jgi:hypothetical protein
MLLKVSKEVNKEAPSGRVRRGGPPARPNPLQSKINTALKDESSDEELCGFEAFDKAKSDPNFARDRLRRDT